MFRNNLVLIKFLILKTRLNFLFIERIVEDNEIVERLVVGKSHENINRLSLKKNFNKYSLLKNPEVSFIIKILLKLINIVCHLCIFKYLSCTFVYIQLVIV